MRKPLRVALAMLFCASLGLLALAQSARSAPLAAPEAQAVCGAFFPPGCRPGRPDCVWIPIPGPSCSTPVPVTPRPPGPPQPPPPPCAPALTNPFRGYTIDESGGVLTGAGCSSFSLSVTAPCLPVLRQPYPRGVVARDNSFEILTNLSSSETSRQLCGTRQDCEAKGYGEQVRNVVVSLKLDLVPDILPVWGWDERLWNVRAQRSSENGWGWIASHIYETSSFDVTDEECLRQYGEGSCRKPLNGPSLVRNEALPAYQVRVSTPWKASYKVDWEERTRTCKCQGSRNPWDSNCCCGQHHPVGGHWTEDYPWCEPESSGACWAGRSTGWNQIDLSPYTGSSWWMWSHNAKPAQQSVGCGVIPVPIIEIQGVLDR